MFTPIAIIGRNCLLPKSLSPKQLWENVIARRNCLEPATQSEWRLDPNSLVNTTTPKKDKVNTTQFGFVKNTFDVDNHFFVDANIINKQDQLTKWLLSVCYRALQDANISLENLKKYRSGVIVGNLIYPTFEFSQFAEAIWLDGEYKKQFDPIYRFMSGYPAHFVAECLGMKVPSFTLDAACASSLYAIKLACDQLQSGNADLMLAGGINAVDSLFLNMGFSALNALSMSGFSRPLQRHADGLIPSHGAAVVALRRLDDAIRNDEPILGVIEGIGLSNDGRSGGILQPNQAGQIQAMELAYAGSSVDPSDISWLECHATGTAVGDATEIKSIQQIFTPHPQRHISALKAAIGHTITASGAAALINVLSAFSANVKPPSQVSTKEAAEFVHSAQLNILEEPIMWEKNENSNRYAAINCFGFGGNNAHLIVSDWNKSHNRHAKVAHQIKQQQKEKIAVIGLEVLTGRVKNKQQLKDLLEQDIQEAQQEYALEKIELMAQETRFPPTDLQHTLAQQLGMLQIVQTTLKQVRSFDPKRTSILVGMECDAEIARWGLRWRLDGYFADQTSEWLAETKDAIVAPLLAVDVVGTLPNVVANRINVQFDLKGPSFSLCAEELSGVRALEVASQSLNDHSIDTAIVGAVDLSCESIHRIALSAVKNQEQVCSDSVVVLILKRLTDAQRDQEKIYAIIDLENQTDQSVEKNSVLGNAHAAIGLQQIAESILELEIQQQSTKEIHLSAMGNQRCKVKLTTA